MAAIIFDPTAFRAAFPAFADTTLYPDATLQAWFGAASGYISSTDYGLSLTGPRLVQALNLMIAHLITLSNIALAGKTAGIVTDSRVGDVSVSMQPPPSKDLWQYWLSTTPYGLQLWALLSAAAVGGIYVSTQPSDRRAFRKAYGVY